MIKLPAILWKHGGHRFNMLKIVQAPLPVLARKAEKVTKFDKELHKIIAQMTQTLENAKDPEGVGLAAPQVAISLQLFIVKESKKAKLQIFVNPEIISPKGQKLSSQLKQKNEENKEVKLEGCLSLQDIWGIVERHEKVKISYQDETGAKHIEEFEGFKATIIQHEVDHLNGILFPQRVLEQNGTLYKSKVNKDGVMEFNEISV